MIDGHSVLCVIPARGGSKGLRGKNLRLLAGKPLIAYTIENAARCRYIDRVIVSTENLRIAVVSREWGADVPFRRPRSLARDWSGTPEVLLHALDWVESHERRTYDIVVLLHATTPLRAVKDITQSLRKLVEGNFDSVFSVTEAHRNPYFNMVEVMPRGRVSLVKKGDFKTRQEAPRVYDMNASIYVWWTRVFRRRPNTLQPRSALYVMPKVRSVDIDDGVDFALAEALLNRRNPHVEIG